VGAVPVRDEAAGSVVDDPVACPITVDTCEPVLRFDH
jgi:hypothetical protein